MGRNPEFVIILAAGRSGSKYLRGLLGAGRECAAVPYDVNFVWRHGNEAKDDDVLEPGSITEAQRSWIHNRITQLARARGGEAKIVVEKTVSNTLRVPFVSEVFPEARFIHLVRDGRAVAESAQRVWNERPSLGYLLGKLRTLSPRSAGYALSYLRNLVRPGGQSRHARVWGPVYPGMQSDLRARTLIDVCARQWSECVTRASAALAGLDATRWMQVRYEDLVGDAAVAEKLANFAGIDDVAAVTAAWQAMTRRGNVEKWRSSLDSETADRLTLALRSELERFGYLAAERREQSSRG